MVADFVFRTWPLHAQLPWSSQKVCGVIELTLVLGAMCLADAAVGVRVMLDAWRVALATFWVLILPDAVSYAVWRTFQLQSVVCREPEQPNAGPSDAQVRSGVRPGSERVQCCTCEEAQKDGVMVKWYRR